MSTRCGMCEHVRAIRGGRTVYECTITQERLSRCTIDHIQHDWTCPDWIQRRTSITAGKNLRIAKCPICGREMWRCLPDVCPICEEKYEKKKRKQEKEVAMPIPCMLDLIEAIFTQTRRDYIQGKTEEWKILHGYIGGKDRDGRLSTARGMYRNAEMFLKSSWASTLADAEIRADQLIKALNRDVEEIIREYAEKKGKTHHEKPRRADRRN